MSPATVDLWALAWAGSDAEWFAVTGRCGGCGDDCGCGGCDGFRCSRCPDRSAS